MDNLLGHLQSASDARSRMSQMGQFFYKECTRCLVAESYKIASHFGLLTNKQELFLKYTYNVLRWWIPELDDG